MRAPRLRTIATYEVRHADADMAGLVDLVMNLLDEGVPLIDLGRHDARGTRFEVRAGTVTDEEKGP